MDYEGFGIIDKIEMFGGIIGRHAKKRAEKKKKKKDHNKWDNSKMVLLRNDKEKKIYEVYIVSNGISSAQCILSLVYTPRDNLNLL